MNPFYLLYYTLDAFENLCGLYRVLLCVPYNAHCCQFMLFLDIRSLTIPSGNLVPLSVDFLLHSIPNTAYDQHILSDT